MLALAFVASFAGSVPASADPTGPPTPTWRPIPKAPIAGRVGAGAVWTGAEMIVWGGVARGATIRTVGDGAAFDPASGTWRSIRPAPGRMTGGGGQAAVWTGRRALFWAGNSPDGPARGAVYNPRTDRWRSMFRGPLGPREGYVSAWTGTELVIVGGTVGDGLAQPIAAAVDPATGRWNRLPGFDQLLGLRPSGAVWSGDRLFVGGLAYECPPHGPCTIDPAFLGYDPATDLLEPIELANAPSASFTPVGWTGSEVFGTGDDRSSVQFYDPATDTWRVGADTTCEGGDRQVAFLGDRYVVACGRDRLGVYSLTTGGWETVPAGPSPLNAYLGSAVVWTDADLVVWSGVARRTGNPTPDRGARITLPP